MDIDRLKVFLVELPLKVDYTNLSVLKQNVFRGLFYSATANGKFLKYLFPSVTEADIARMEDFHTIARNDRKPFYTVKPTNPSKYSHPPTQACARTLKAGEPVYRCEQCGFDETCVLCVHCFNKDDHKGHDVTVYRSKGTNGGICDCGDPEAFRALNCKCQLDSSTEEPIPEELSAALRETIKVCLDYVIDILNFSIQTLPLIDHNIDRNGNRLTTEFLSNYSSLPPDRYAGALDENTPNLWYLVIWNDEHHDFHSAESAVNSATSISPARVKGMITEIDKNGRCILKEAEDYHDLLESKLKIRSTGLFATIMSARDYMRDEIVSHIFDWLNEIVSFSSNNQFRVFSQNHLSELLLNQASISKWLPTEVLDELASNIQEKCFENGIIYEGKLMNHGLTSFQNQLSLTDLSKPIKSILQPMPDLNSNYFSRIQILLTYELRIKKSTRKNMSTLLISPIVSDLEKKSTFSGQFLSIYPTLLTILALSDREDLLNSLLDISSQILTCPKCVGEILQHQGFPVVLGPLIRIIEENSCDWNEESGYPNVVEISKKKPYTYKRIKAAINRGIRDVTCLTERVADLESIFHNEKNIVMLLLLFRNFQGYWPMKKKYGDHVEHETYDFVVHLEYSLPILKIAKSIGRAINLDKETVRTNVDMIVKYLNMRKLRKNAPGIADFKVSKEEVSLINPINSLLSYIIEANGFDIFENILRGSSEPFMNISDVSLRSIVLGSQIKIGFWIRNGISASRQGSLYFESIMSDFTYFRDFHLNQIACIIDDPKITLYNFLDRWELLPWYFNEEAYDKTVYDQRFFSIAEKFIVFLYNLLVDREAFLKIPDTERLELRAKNYICYSLCDGPKAYSSIKSEMASELLELPNFDEILYELATYQSPTSLIDSGMYRLKSEVFEGLDPLNLYLDSSKFQDVSESLIKNIAGTRKCKDDEVVLIPKLRVDLGSGALSTLGNFTKTKEFAKLIYKFLQLAIDTSDETYLPHLLHLIHAVLIDDENIHGESYLNENFVTIPICDLLLTVVESKMSPRVIQKSDYLVEQFVSKDRRIIDNLVDCFGENFVNGYKKRKTGLFESDIEKKKRKNMERQAKVMKKFEKQRKKFLDKNKEYDTGSKEDDEETVAGKRTCVLCGEHDTLEEPFGLLATKTRTSNFWKIPRYQPEYADLAFKPWSDQQTPKSDDLYGKGYSYTQDSSPRFYGSMEASVISTCGHFIHHKCFKRATGMNKLFPCPLCRNLHNIFVPSFSSLHSKALEDDYKKVITSAPRNLKYNALYNSTENSDSSKTSRLLGLLLDQEYFKLEGVLDPDSVSFADQIVPVLKSELWSEIPVKNLLPEITPEDRFFNGLQSLSVIIADTIRMNEISTRIGGEPGLYNFLTQIPGSTKTLLRSLIQSRSLISKFRYKKEFIGKSVNLEAQIKKFWQSEKLFDGVFNEIVVLFFQTDESLQTLTRLGMSKLVSIAINSFYSRLSIYPKFQESLKGHKRAENALSEDQFRLFTDFLNRCKPDEKLLPQSRSDLVGFYYGLERVLLPFLRQMVIFKDLLTCEPLGENDFQSSVMMTALEGNIQNQAYLDDTRALTDALEVPSFGELLEGLSKTSSDFSFEFAVHDIVHNAKIPKYMVSGILTLEYPGIVHLIDLPTDFNTCVLDEDSYSIKGGYDKIICLHCSKRIRGSRHTQHMLGCSSGTGIFYLPKLNNLRICVYIGNSAPISVDIPAPYLTKHGEVKRPNSTGQATLNSFRYEYLNRIWLNQGLYGFVTRSIFGARQTPETMNFNFGRADEEDDSEDGEFVHEDEDNELEEFDEDDDRYDIW